jgi:hypothetical protein
MDVQTDLGEDSGRYWGAISMFWIYCAYLCKELH